MMSIGRRVRLPVTSRLGCARVARLGHRTAFVAVVVLSPWRARISLVTRRTPPIYGDFTDVLLFAGELALLVTLTLWGVDRLLAPRPIDLGPRFLAWPVAGLLVMATVGIPFATDPALAAYTVRLGGRRSARTP